MRANSAEFEREDTGGLLVPMVHVERSIGRASTIVSFEIPDEHLQRMTDRKVVRNRINQWVHRVGKAFLAEWDERQREKARRLEELER